MARPPFVPPKKTAPPKKIKQVLQVGFADAASRRLHRNFSGADCKVTTLDPNGKADIAAPYERLENVRMGQFDAVWSAIVLVRLTPAEGKVALAEWFRVLAPGGTLMLSVPDAILAAELLAGKQTPSVYAPKLPNVTALDLLYGYNLKEENSTLFASAYTPDAMGAALKQAGFTAIRLRREKGGLLALALKPGAGVEKRDAVQVLDADTPPGLPDELDREPLEWTKPDLV